jgi:hypothetical protein
LRQKRTFSRICIFYLAFFKNYVLFSGYPSSEMLTISTFSLNSNFVPPEVILEADEADSSGNNDIETAQQLQRSEQNDSVLFHLQQ